MDQALSDVTVIDLSQVIAMPFCTMLLADLGAKLIKVESRERGRERVSLGVKRTRDGVEERVPVAQYRDRNKLGITLELKTAKGVELFKELVKRVDVVTENFSVGTMDRLGLGYDDLKNVNPAIIYASVTAFGQNGPYAPLRDHRTRRPHARSRLRDRGCAARSPRRDRRHHRGLDEPAHEGRGGESTRARRRSGSAGQQRRGDGRGPAGASAGDVRRARA